MPLNDRSTLIDYLSTRRSARPRDLVAPGPDDAQMAWILRLASRTPDHGKLVPYRFVLIDNREAMADLFEAALLDDCPDAHATKREKFRAKAHWAPQMVALVSSPLPDHKIPLWEQELTVGAVGMNLLHAAHAHGFTGGWITGAQSYAPTVVEALCEPGERIAGFFYLGTPAHDLEDRERPDMADIATIWRG